MMRKHRRAIISLITLLIAGLLVLGWWLIPRLLSPVETDPYAETFDAAGDWTAGEGVTATGQVVDGVYEMSIDPDLSGDSFWTTGGRNFADGVYQVEATPLEGAEDNGYGMLLRVDTANESFYVFKVSSDGYVYIGLCSDKCADQQALFDRDWFGSPSVAQGFGVTNILRVVAEGSDLAFYVNGDEVGRVSDETLEAGDIGILGETFTPGGLKVTFDNFTVTPLETE